MGTPRNSSMLKLGQGWSGGTTFGELYGLSFVNVHTEFPFSEISVQSVHGRCESSSDIVCMPQLREESDVIRVQCQLSVGGIRKIFWLQELGCTWAEPSQFWACLKLILWISQIHDGSRSGFYTRSGVVYSEDFCQLFSSQMAIFMLSEGDSVCQLACLNLTL